MSEQGARQDAGRAMLEEVDAAWQRPVPAEVGAAESGSESAASPVQAKLERIVMPAVQLSGMELGRALAALSAASEEFDATGVAPRGVNIVLVDPAKGNPAVNLTLRHLPLGRVLDFVTASVGYEYEVQDDAVVVRPAGDPVALDTRFFAVPRATFLRLSGRTGGAPNLETSSSPAEPGAGRVPSAFDAATRGSTAGAENEGAMLRNFLQLAGVDFDRTPGSTLAFDGSQLVVTQTPRNLARIANILRRFRDVRQVEIEAKFMEVQEGALEELGVRWSVSTSPDRPTARAQARYATGDGVTRSLADAFRGTNAAQQISITGPEVPDGGLSLPTNPPTMPGGVLLGTGAGALADVRTSVGEFDVQALVRALAQKSGTELLSAPKLTVLSGTPATITVAQEMRYPQSYGEIQSQVGTGSLSGGGSAGVSITSGTPQEFATRNVGVELRVRATVEEDNRSISLDLHPKVTEFEGFVEYGGPSVAISGGTTVTVPPGFYQPIFSVRELSTQVTLWDGATLVMGGLTREDVKKVRDKVPVLGSLPLLGRLFRSTGESTQKRNLLIFVTANLVTPGGGLQKRATGSPAETTSVAP
ncbi:MAG TPA: hypothetical protein VEB66_00210 [Opitutaceae bacterium]|nr:hypothetical protein [Opitutaceae bacterium]